MSTKLNPGCYEFKRTEVHFDAFHYLYVFKKNGKLYYRIDHCNPIEADLIEDQFVLGRIEITRRLPKGFKCEYRKVKVTVSFENDKGHDFSFVALNAGVLARIFRLFPGLSKSFGFLMEGQ